MMGYKDVTWCSRYLSGECKNSKCVFAFTSQEKEKAVNWWGNIYFPINIGDRMDNDCGYTNGKKESYGRQLCNTSQK